MSKFLVHMDNELKEIYLFKNFGNFDAVLVALLLEWQRFTHCLHGRHKKKTWQFDFFP